MKRIWAALLAPLVWSLAPDTRAETVLVAYGSTMRYLANSSDPAIGPLWTDEAFSDGSWVLGTYGVGYETGTGAQSLIATPVPAGAYSVYTRAPFTLTDPGMVQNLFVGADWDDGWIAWLNGVEVYRSPQLPAGALSWNTNAALHESSNGVIPEYRPLHDISGAIPLLHAGTNVLAVGIWNSGAPSSSDLALVPKLVMNKEPEVVRGPYLQLGTSTSLVVRWRTDVATDSEVRYGDAPGNLPFTRSDPTVTTEHIVTLYGLSPATSYAYAVGSSGGKLAGDDASHVFVTAPPPGQAQATRVWVLGDSGTASADARAVRNAYSAFTGGRHTDLWLMLGDNAYVDGTDAEYQTAVFDTYPEMLRKSVLWPTLGNHDGHTADSASQTGPYYNVFTLPRAGQSGGPASGTEAYYAFDHGNVHFVSLDSYESPRTPGSAMLTWLAQDLAATTQDWIVAFWHHPPYSKGSYDSDVALELLEMRQNVLPILEDHGVDLVLAGHSHAYERSFLIDGHYGPSSTFTPAHKKDGGDGRPAGSGAYTKPWLGPDPHEGAVYAVAGSSGSVSGGPFGHPAMVVSMALLGSMVLDFNGNRLDAAFLDSTGVARDSFAIVKQPALLPIADFTASPRSGPAPLAVHFTDRSVHGPIGWSWDFDDDGIVDSTLQHPDHAYAPGLYTVALEVRNVAGTTTEVKNGYVCVTATEALAPITGFGFSADRVTMTWRPHPRAASYDVVKGSLGLLRSSGGDFGLSLASCLSDDVAEEQASDPLYPSPGSGFYYLVRAVECGGRTGTYDGGGAGQRGSRDAEIAASGVRCP